LATLKPAPMLETFTAPPPRVVNPHGASQVLLVCEHASNYVPRELCGLGATAETLTSHAAWDPGAIEVAEAMSVELDATLVSAQVSRLVYDCNRPPEAASAIIARSEAHRIPGNEGLDAQARRARVELVYKPFQAALSGTLQARADRPTVLVTIHSFTRVFNGAVRDVELGILCDRDERLADAMLARAPGLTDMLTAKNDPYGPADGVTHTLKEHGLSNGLLNVMIEVRNDLLRTGQQQREVAYMLCALVSDSIAALRGQGAA
jgi:predicted N-formylglutamate amidohydrolase